MASSTIASLFTGFAANISSTFGAMLPVIIPVAIALAVLFGALSWLRGAAGRR